MWNSRSVDGVCVLVAQTLPELLQALPSNAGIAPCGFTGARSMPTGGGTRPYVLMGKVATQSGSRLRALRLEEGDPLPNAEFQVCRWCLCSCGPDFARAAAGTAVQCRDCAMRLHRCKVNANWRGHPPLCLDGQSRHSERVPPSRAALRGGRPIAKCGIPGL